MLTQLTEFSRIEEEFGIHVSSYEITEENLAALRAVASTVASKHPLAVG